MKILTMVLVLLSLGITSFAAAQNNQKEAAYEQARQDYRVYLQQLKALSQQYKEVTGEIQKVLKEEGVPTWDEGSGTMTVDRSSNNFAKTNALPTVFGDIDIKETDSEIIVKADLPGIKKEALKITIQDRRLLKIIGQRNQELEESTQQSSTQYVRSERQHGNFERVIELPSLVKETGTEAKYQDGVLTVKIIKEIQTKKEVSIVVQ